jgi:hypothetical protein
MQNYCLINTHAVMGRHGITDAYAFGGDLSATGFTELRP